MMGDLGHRLERLTEWIVVPLMLGLIAVGFAAVCLRHSFDGRYALFWAEEVIRYGFIWIFWLCAPVLVARGSMFAVDMLVNALPPALQRAVGILVYLLIMVLVALTFWQGWLMTVINMGQESSALQMPLGLIYFAIPFGSALIFLVCIVGLLRLVGILGRSGVRA
jgi:TRAP-type C4-dicarboxylate transport system permease small subunit